MIGYGISNCASVWYGSKRNKTSQLLFIQRIKPAQRHDEPCCLLWMAKCYEIAETHDPPPRAEHMARSSDHSRNIVLRHPSFKSGGASFASCYQPLDLAPSPLQPWLGWRRETLPLMSLLRLLHQPSLLRFLHQPSTPPALWDRGWDGTEKLTGFIPSFISSAPAPQLLTPLAEKSLDYPYLGLSVAIFAGYRERNDHGSLAQEK